MSRATREVVYAALFARMQTIPGLKLASRTLQSIEQTQLTDMPAMFQTQDKQTIKYQGVTPLGNIWRAHWIVYVASQDPAVPASTLLNNAVEAALAVMAPHPGEDRNTLGGLVEYASVQGDIETYDGLLGNKAVAVIPIAIVLGGF